MSKSPLPERERIARIICPHAFEFRQGRHQPRQDRAHNREIALAKADLILSALLPEEGQGLSPSQSQPVSDALRATTSGAGPSALLSFEAQLQERLADPEWVAKWATLEGDERPFVEMLLALRKDEGNSVTLLSDNPDFNGQPSNAIECCGAWTGWKDRRFTGDTLRAAVLAAYKALSTPPATPALGLIEGEQGSSNAISGPTPKSADTEAEPSAAANS